MNKPREAIVVTFGNFKGGTGKTTNSTLLAYSLAKKGYKVLLSDQDPQANATTLYFKTKAMLEATGVVTFKKTLIRAIQEGDLLPIVTEIKENLYLLPSASDFAFYGRFLEEKFPLLENTQNTRARDIERVHYFNELLTPLKKDYDFIFIDVPPTISVITDAALYASDFVVVVLQTQERSLAGAEQFTVYLQSLVDIYGANIDILGILPVLMKNGAAVDLATLENAKDVFGAENIFQNVVTNMERIKRFDLTGITDEDMHDKKVHERYDAIAEEFIDRLKNELTVVEEDKHE